MQSLGLIKQFNLVNEEITQSNLNLTERSKWSFGFSLQVFFSALVLLTTTQIIRFLVLHYDQQVFLNDKFAFSLNFPITIIYILYVLVFATMGYYLVRHWNYLATRSRLGFIFILSGGLANLGERIYFGHVVDYIFILNGVLNIADFYIFLGVVLVLTSRNNSEKI